MISQSSPLCLCSVCSQTFWSIGPGSARSICPGCSPEVMAQGRNPFPEDAPPASQAQFVSLSALPPEKRFLQRKGGSCPPKLLVPRRLAQVCGRQVRDAVRRELISSIPWAGFEDQL